MQQRIHYRIMKRIEINLLRRTIYFEEGLKKDFIFRKKNIPFIFYLEKV
jgi:hypothetical protein